MARPIRCRCIRGVPEANYFKPRGIPVTSLGEVCLGMDEFEAIRLADLDGQYQEKAAKQMNVSRQTFGNIIETAHRKIADAVVNGKALKIEGGVVQMMQRQFVCSDCKHEWSVAFGTGRPEACPKCQSKNVCRSEKDKGRGRGGRGAGSGQCLRRECQRS
ncbi:MAG: hypothetical protein A3G33_07630 [Omnitrophica bacterium RIFCSPLOWO2_12_FULL_44_17]|uniref:UPF0251 protein A3G33_07630 n=1 Tax=Candidatus Danuiimicrobium aquiferis TaxID=1801832 RepID=A0A1G1KYV1_9BACT|nr:MAG: hypothetical protein A3B72_07930 [Omnitrophica bacterium RIFCSPHIGHO2_02_FULL_45_28]OGW91460.1 MAG: hypothetical protein A3E74_00755 [Omnitrophica bacterium RIFCSPHIGHO2_12_FULL_44_12]OGW98088.1 MAG: hypothetical protein A3G33_07630 [Omnitrophica bacterium RIFCSPLOWO2_12_FULL_44_17]OGX03470.1 MAG: hypothetical protein A3J12_02595 [Omnitrophica bacterium RIFCSPLOWO2_02_FULL_44_11]